MAETEHASFLLRSAQAKHFLTSRQAFKTFGEVEAAEGTSWQEAKERSEEWVNESIQANSFLDFLHLPVEVKSYTVVRKEREEFRKKLVSLIISSEEEIARDDGSFPDAQEKEIMRYYYYIKHGIGEFIRNLLTLI